MMAVLLAPHMHAVLTQAGPHDHEAAIHELLRPVADRLTVARRDLTHARQCLAAQFHFAREPQGRFCKRFCRREFFEEARVLRHVLGPLEEMDPDPFQLWEELVVRLKSDGAAPDRKPRRRRRRRKRRVNSGAQSGEDGA